MRRNASAIQCPNKEVSTAEQLLRVMSREDALRAHREAVAMARLSLKVKEQDGARHCVLPFCHTAEGEALGGCLSWEDPWAGPRPSRPIYKNLQEIADEDCVSGNPIQLKQIDLEAGRISEILKACQILSRRGEKVILNVSGPMTVLNVLMDSLDVVRLMTAGMDSSKPGNDFLPFSRQAGVVQAGAVLSLLEESLIEYIEAAGRAGAAAISYADAMSAEDICGPELAAWMARTFTIPFLIKAEQRLGAGKLLFLCPKTAQSLEETGRIQWEEIRFHEPKPYIQACMQVCANSAEERALIVGQQCLAANGCAATVKFLRIADWMDGVTFPY